MNYFPIFALTTLLALTPVAYSQETPGAAQEPPQSVGTEAERVVRLQTVIESDEARLKQLRQDLTEAEDRFESFGRDLAERKIKLDALRAQLEETVDPAGAAELRAEIGASEEKYEVIKTETDLAFTAEKALRAQVETLEKKIGIDKVALEELLGTAEEPQREESPVSSQALTEPAADAPPKRAPVTGVIPGMPGAPKSPGAGPAQVQEQRRETAEQIESRKQAEKSELEAEEAEQAVTSFLERKAALQEQIDLEKTLLDTSELSRANFVKAVEIRRKELADAIADRDQTRTEEAQKKLASANEQLSTIDAQIEKRQNTLEDFYRRMQALQEEQLIITGEAEQKRRAAEASRKQSIWLNSPFNPRNIIGWALDRGPDMLAVIVSAALLLFLIRRFVKRIARAMVGKGRRHRKDATTRADTLALSFGSATTMLIVIVGVLLVFEAAGVDIATILGGAAILGVAIAFGAQNLMRDYFNGFIILIEDQYELNDLVTIGNITGRVERVSLRTTALRDLQGKLHFIPNGEIKSVTNRSYEWAQIVFEVRVSYKENVDRVMEEMLSIARELCAEPEFKDSIIDEPEMLGVDEFAEFGVIIKFVLKTAPGDLFKIKREILRRIKNRFDEIGIEIPVPGVFIPRKSD